MERQASSQSAFVSRAGSDNLACKAGCQCFQGTQVPGVEINVLTTVCNFVFMCAVTKELHRQDATR